MNCSWFLLWNCLKHDLKRMTFIYVTYSHLYFNEALKEILSEEGHHVVVVAWVWTIKMHWTFKRQTRGTIILPVQTENKPSEAISNATPRDAFFTETWREVALLLSGRTRSSFQTASCAIAYAASPGKKNGGWHPGIWHRRCLCALRTTKTFQHISSRWHRSRWRNYHSPVLLIHCYGSSGAQRLVFLREESARRWKLFLQSLLFCLFGINPAQCQGCAKVTIIIINYSTFFFSSSTKTYDDCRKMM